MVTMHRNNRGCFEIIKVEGLCLANQDRIYSCKETATGLMRKCGLKLWIVSPQGNELIFIKR
jgi:hypothetical protein